MLTTFNHTIKQNIIITANKFQSTLKTIQELIVLTNSHF